MVFILHPGHQIWRQLCIITHRCVWVLQLCVAMQESSLLSEGRRMQRGEGESLLSSSSCTTTCVNTDSHGRPFFTAASSACARVLKASERCDLNRFTSCLLREGKRGRMGDKLNFDGVFLFESGRGEAALKSTVWKFPLSGAESLRYLKQWKMDDFQRDQVVFALSVVSLFAPLLCQEGSQRAQLSIQRGRWRAKNTPVHWLWNTLPLFTGS